ncbi:MAG: mechanosensitive ion channel family protein [Phycisphaerae bacterium]|jgi:MscS family membrane protein
MKPLTRTVILSIALLAIAGGARPAGAQAQDSQPTSQPAASQPAVNVLRSPQTTIQFFLETAGDPQAGDEPCAQAMRCLDFSELDAEKVAAEGTTYVRQLADILRRLEQEKLFDPADKEVLPDEPVGTVQSFGKGALTLELRRLPRVVIDEQTGEARTVQEWRFPSYIVAEIPVWHAELDERIARIQAEAAGLTAEPATAVAQVDPQNLRTVQHTISFFLDEWSAAQADGARYATALACLDFADVVRDTLREEMDSEDAGEIEAALRERGPEYVQEVREKVGISYADGLHAVLQALLDDGSVVLGDLPARPELYVKPTYSITSRTNRAVAISLERQGELPGTWRFSARTVKDVPRMQAALAAAPAEVPAVQPVSPTGGAAGEAAPVVVAPPPTAAAASRAPRDETASPRATLQTFLGAMQAGDVPLAVSCLDTSELSPSERELAHVRAGKLWAVLARYQKVLPATLSDNQDAPRQEPLIPPSPTGRIQLGKEQTGPRQGEWLFTSQTVRDVEQLYESVESQPIHESWRTGKGGLLPFVHFPALYVRERINELINDRIIETVDPATGETVRVKQPGRLPHWLGNQFYTLQVWQWLGIAIALLVGPLVRWLSQILLPRLSRWLLRVEGAELLPSVVRSAFAPTSTLAMVATWWGLVQFLDLNVAIMTWTWWVLRVAMTIVGVYAFYRIIDVAMGYFAARAARTSSRLDDVLAPLLQKTLKVLVIAVGGILFVKMLGFQVTPLLAGLGVGGLAFGLAAQDTLKNFFGSVNVVLDRPFQVGDWIKIGDVEGTVESVGLRSSRIRTFYNSQVTVPNSDIMTSQIDNLGRRRYRRISCMISVLYSTTPEKLEAFCAGIRELIRRHPYTRKDYYHCWVNAFAPSSIDILLYCFHETPDWGTELRERHRLFLDIVRLAQRLDVGFAFPTQTVHLHHESSPGDTPPPPDARLPGDPAESIRFGATEAEKLAHEAFSEQNELPPPVKY